MAALNLTISNTSAGTITLSDEELDLLAVVLARKMDLDSASLDERVRRIVSEVCAPRTRDTDVT